MLKDDRRRSGERLSLPRRPMLKIPRGGRLGGGGGEPVSRGSAEESRDGASGRPSQHGAPTSMRSAQVRGKAGKQQPKQKKQQQRRRSMSLDSMSYVNGMATTEWQKYLQAVAREEDKVVANAAGLLHATTFTKRATGTRPVHLVRCLKKGEGEEVLQSFYIAPNKDDWQGFDPEDMDKCRENEHFEHAILFSGACMPTVEFDYDGFTDWIIGDQVAFLVDTDDAAAENDEKVQRLCSSTMPWIHNPCSSLSLCCPVHFLAQSLWFAVPSALVVGGCLKVAFLKRKVLPVFPAPSTKQNVSCCPSPQRHTVLRFVGQWHTSRFHQSCMASTGAPVFEPPEKTCGAPKVQKSQWR